MKSAELKWKLKNTLHQIEPCLDQRPWIMLVFVIAGILLFIALTVFGRLGGLGELVTSAKPQADGVVLIGGVPMSDFIIGLIGILFFGAMTGALMCFLVLFVYCWFKK